MIFDARTLVRNARSIADLQETQFISYEDTVNALNEGYREIYNKYTESDSDFWIEEVIVTPTEEMLDPNATNAYLIPLPDNFYKLRTVSWSNGQWLPMNKFSMSERDNFTGIPMYQIRNGNLWVIGINLNEVKIAYYIPMETVTVPYEPRSLTPETAPNMRNITSMYWDAKGQVLYYIYSGTIVKSYDPASGTVSTLYTSVNAIATVWYSGGYVYFRDTVALTILTAPLATTLVPVSLGLSSVANYSLSPSTGKLYYATASATFSASLTGTGSTQVLASTSTFYLLYQGTPLWVASNLIVINGTPSAVASVKIVTDGVWLYSLDSNGTLSRYTLTDGALELVDTVASSLSIIGAGVSYSNQIIPQVSDFDAVWLPASWIPTLDYSAQAVVQSLTQNTVFDYPTNEVNELMSYQMAVYFLRKQTDQAKIALVAAAVARLWDRFYSVNKRDEYQSTRINNSYQTLGGFWGGW